MTRLQQACYNLLVQHYMKPKKKNLGKITTAIHTVIVHCVSNLQSLFSLFIGGLLLQPKQVSYRDSAHSLWFRAMATNPLKTCSVSDHLYVVSSVSFSQLITVFSNGLYISISAGNIIVP